MTDRADYAERLDELAGAARRERRAFEPPPSPPDEARATEYLRTGLGPTVALYLDARTGGRGVAFSADELSLFHRTVNDWLALYARCYGVEMDPDFTVREAAELLVQTHDIVDTARLLTTVPPRTATNS